MAVAWVMFAMMACGGGKDGDTSGAVTEPTGGIDTAPPPENVFLEDVQPIIDANCGPCHIDGGTTKSLVLDDLRGVIGRNSTELLGLRLIEPLYSEQSYLYLKVANAPEIIADAMPPGGALTESEVELIKVWIDEGCESREE